MNCARLEKPLEGDDITRILPHRPPFLLVDSIVEWEPRHRCLGLKTWEAAEPFFQGHFPACPVVPGVLIVEAMAQVAGLLAMESFAAPTPFFYLARIENMRFRRVVQPGALLSTEATLCCLRASLFRTSVVSRVNEGVAAQGELTFVISKSASSDILRGTIHRGKSPLCGAERTR